MPVAIGTASTSLEVPIVEDETYVLHAASTRALALHVSVTGGSSIVTVLWLDVNADARATPLDALLVINELNSNGSGPAGGRVTWM